MARPSALRAFALFAWFAVPPGSFVSPQKIVRAAGPQVRAPARPNSGAANTREPDTLRSMFIRLTLGTNNTERELGRLEYSLPMVKECGLTWKDMGMPKPDDRKPVQARNGK